MTGQIGSRAMVLAAGLGVRMRPITSHTPKPLVTVAGQSLIGHCFERLRAARVRHAVVNVHHLPEQIEEWALRQTEPATTISDERAELLDTGGGVARALPLLGGDPFFVLNSDSFWIEGESPALDRLKRAWDDARMDCLLLVCPPEHTVGYNGRGDFVADGKGRLRRRTGDETGLAFIGAYLVHPRVFADAPPGKFSMNVLWDRAIAQGRLWGIMHDGLWLHVGTPAAIAEAERALAAHAARDGGQ
jgi:MurNAc alpha-1-phosphate uridylyltransferase